MEKKRIVILTATWNSRTTFIDDLKHKLENTNCVIHSIGGINAMDDIVSILDWKKKQDKDKVNRLAQELYECWRDLDEESYDKIIDFINNCKGNDNLIIMNTISDEFSKDKLEILYPNQIVYFEVNIQDESTLETELERFIDIKQLRLKQYIK